MSMPDATTPRAAAEAARICACFNLRRAALSVTRLFDEVLQPSGLRSTQFVVMVAVHAQGSMELPTLATEMGVDRSALTRRLQPLERRGYVRLERSDVGGPSVATLTDEGRRKLDRTVPLWREAQSRFLESLGPDRWDEMQADLRAAHAAAEEA